MPQSEGEDDMPRHDEWAQLDVLDSKTAALLRLSGIAMSITSLPLLTGQTTPSTLPWIKALIGLLLVSSACSLLILQVNWEPTGKTVSLRRLAYWVALGSTVLGLCTLAVFAFWIIK